MLGLQPLKAGALGGWILGRSALTRMHCAVRGQAHGVEVSKEDFEGRLKNFAGERASPGCRAPLQDVVKGHMTSPPGIFPPKGSNRLAFMPPRSSGWQRPTT
jgi:hypothetical protein